MAKNVYRIAKTTWSRWSKERQALYNRTRGELKRMGKHLVIGSDTKLLTQKQWEVLLHNVSWIAAEGTYDMTFDKERR